MLVETRRRVINMRTRWRHEQCGWSTTRQVRRRGKSSTWRQQWEVTWRSREVLARRLGCCDWKWTWEAAGARPSGYDVIWFSARTGARALSSENCVVDITLYSMCLLWTGQLTASQKGTLQFLSKEQPKNFILLQFCDHLVCLFLLWLQTALWFSRYPKVF